MAWAARVMEALALASVEELAAALKERPRRWAAAACLEERQGRRLVAAALEEALVAAAWRGAEREERISCGSFDLGFHPVFFFDVYKPQTNDFL
jgi:hypothetical protein